MSEVPLYRRFLMSEVPLHRAVSYERRTPVQVARFCTRAAGNEAHV